jgi:hypothetical protein
MSAGIKTGNFATDWLIDRVNDSAKKNSETGKYEAGLFEGAIGGAFGLDVGLIEDTKQVNIDNTNANELIRNSTYTREDLGFSDDQKLTESQVKSATKDLLEQKEKDKTNEQRTYEAGIRQEGYDRTDKRYLHERQEARRDRNLTRDLSIQSNDLAMQMKLMDSDLADKRMAYDRETRRMDRRDRMIAQLMSGIGQLGGAFAL